jgi:hypothetical protein
VTQTFESVFAELVSMGVPADKAELRARLMGLSPLLQQPLPSGALEKSVEHAGDRLMLALGFVVIKFSHPGRTKQTPGIPDRRYYRVPRVVGVTKMPDGRVFENRSDAHVVWWEAKSATGTQRPEQKLFQELVESCGEQYVLGGLEKLNAWLLARGVVSGFEDNGTPILPLGEVQHGKGNEGREGSEGRSGEGREGGGEAAQVGVGRGDEGDRESETRRSGGEGGCEGHQGPGKARRRRAGD